MRILLGGVRGTTPRTEPEFVGYGGHTTCVLVTGEDGTHLLLDAGSGVHTVNPHLTCADHGDGRESSCDLLLLMTHLHLDHLLGLPLLAPLFDAAWRVEIAAVAHEGASPAAALERLLSPPLWPFGLDEMPARVTTTTLDPGELDPARPVLHCGGLEIRGVAVPHPDGCTAWRIDEPATGAALVFATDMEWSAADDAQREAFLALLRTPRPADLLVMDGHFSAAELPERRGWGHSSTAECVEVARTAGAEQLLITHHAPVHDDAVLAARERDLQRMWGRAALARQGTVIELPVR